MDEISNAAWIAAAREEGEFLVEDDAAVNETGYGAFINAWYEINSNSPIETPIDENVKREWLEEAKLAFENYGGNLEDSGDIHVVDQERVRINGWIFLEEEHGVRYQRRATEYREASDKVEVGTGEYVHRFKVEGISYDYTEPPFTLEDPFQITATVRTSFPVNVHSSLEQLQQVCSLIEQQLHEEFPDLGYDLGTFEIHAITLVKPGRKARVPFEMFEVINCCFGVDVEYNDPEVKDGESETRLHSEQPRVGDQMVDDGSNRFEVIKVNSREKIRIRSERVTAKAKTRNRRRESLLVILRGNGRWYEVGVRPRDAKRHFYFPWTSE